MQRLCLLILLVGGQGAFSQTPDRDSQLGIRLLQVGTGNPDVFDVRVIATGVGVPMLEVRDEVIVECVGNVRLVDAVRPSDGTLPRLPEALEDVLQPEVRALECEVPGMWRARIISVIFASAITYRHRTNERGEALLMTLRLQKPQDEDAHFALKVLPEFGSDPTRLWYRNLEHRFEEQALSEAVVSSGETFVRGDANNDGSVEVNDAVVVLQHLFVQGSPPECEDAADANDDGSVDLADPLLILQLLFAQGVAPSAPYPDSGPDPTADGLRCLLRDS